MTEKKLTGKLGSKGNTRSSRKAAADPAAVSRKPQSRASKTRAAGKAAPITPPAHLTGPALIEAGDLLAYHQAQQARAEALRREIASLHARLDDAGQLLASRTQVIDDIDARRVAAENQRAVMARTLRHVNHSLVWRYARIVRAVGRRLPPVGALSAFVFESVLQLFNGRIFQRAHLRAARLARANEDRAAILASDLFDASWYVEQYPDVAEYRHSPLEHFLRYGAAEARNPNPFFDTAWYLAAYPEAVASERNPLAYYALFGIAQRHAASPRFDTHWYGVQFARHLTGGMTPLQHYLHAGQWLALPTNAAAAARETAGKLADDPVIIPAEPDLPPFRLMDPPSGPASESSAAQTAAANGSQPGKIADQ